MNSRWRTFLEDAGAVFADGRVAHFGNPAREIQVAASGSTIADLSHRGLIAVAGADALSFLQGQFTNDLMQLTPEQGLISGWCSPKGRLLAVLRILRIGDTCYLRLPAEILAATLERLRKYVLTAKVTLEDASDAWVGLGCAGPDSEAELGRAIGAVPQAPDRVVHAQGLAVIRLPGGGPRFEIFGQVEAVIRLWSALDVRAAPVGAAAWELLDILAGIPIIYPQTVDQFIPQMVNLEALGGVSFKKGCYTGQEIVARLYYRGTVKRRMYLARIATDATPAPGTPIYRAGDGAEAFGALVTASPAPDGGHAALAVVMTQYAGREDLRLGARDGPAVRLQAPPYPLPAGPTG